MRAVKSPRAAEAVFERKPVQEQRGDVEIVPRLSALHGGGQLRGIEVFEAGDGDAVGCDFRRLHGRKGKAAEE